MPYDVQLADTASVQVPRALPPSVALLIYGEGAFALKHPVVQVGEEYVLSAGVPLSSADMHALIAMFAGQGMQLVNERTLATGTQSMVWWVPPGLRGLLFDAKYTQTTSIAQLNGVPVPLPGLVMQATPGRLAVYAVKGNGRPGPETALFAAPFWNMFNNNTMCQGTVRFPGICSPQTQAAWEACFFESVFTGPSRSDKYLSWGRSYEELLQQAICAGVFPEEVLVSAGQTLGTLCGRT